MEHQESNKFLAWLLAGVLCSFGIILFAIFSYLSTEQKKYPKNKVSLITMVFLAFLWLFISPKYNAITICTRQAIQTEITEKYQRLYEITEPFIQKDRIFTYQLVPQLINIHVYLEHESEKQSLPEYGSCGYLCNALKRIYNELEIPVNNLYEQYDPDEEDNQAFKIINDNLFRIEKLSEDRDYEWFELLQDFNEYKAKVINQTNIIKEKPPLENSIAYAISMLESFKSDLEKKAKEFNNSKLDKIILGSINQTINRTFETIGPQIKNLKETLDRIKQVNKQFYLQTQDSYKINEQNIRLTVNLIWKHSLHYWNKIIIAFFIDIVALMLILFPVYINIIKNKGHIVEVM